MMGTPGSPDPLSWRLCAAGGRHHPRRHSLVVSLVMVGVVWLTQATAVSASARSRKLKKGAAKATFPPEPTAAAAAHTAAPSVAAPGGPSTLLVVVSTVLVTLLVVSTVMGIITSCVLWKMLRRSRRGHRDDAYPLLPHGAPTGSLYGADATASHAREWRGGADDAALLQTVARHYSSATPAQRLQLAQLFTTTTTSIGVSSTGSHCSSPSQSPLGTGAAMSSQSHGFLASAADQHGDLGASGGESNAPRLHSTATAPPPPSSSADVSVENTPGLSPGQPSRGDRSPMMLGVPSTVAQQMQRASIAQRRALLSGSRAGTNEQDDAFDTRLTGGAAVPSPAFHPTTAKDEDVLNTSKTSRYHVVRRVGDGAFSSVYLVTRKSDGQPFAMKYMVCLNDRERATALRECEILHSVQGHPGVIQIADMFMSFQFQLNSVSPPPPSQSAVAGADSGVVAASARSSPSLWARHPGSVPGASRLSNPSLRHDGDTVRTPTLASSSPSSMSLLAPMLPPPVQLPGFPAAAPTKATTSGRPLTPASPLETTNSWLASLPAPSAAKVRALLKTAEATNATVNLTDLFRDLATAAGDAALPPGVRAPVPVGLEKGEWRDGAAVGSNDDDAEEGGAQLHSQGLDGFILSETDTERLMHQARLVRQRRAQLARGHALPPAVPTPTIADVTFAGGAAKAVVTPYTELRQELSSAHGTSSGSSGQPTRGTPLLSAARPSSSATSSPGLHSNRSAVSGSRHSHTQVRVLPTGDNVEVGVRGTAEAPPVVAVAASPETTRRDPPQRPSTTTATDWWSPPTQTTAAGAAAVPPPPQSVPPPTRVASYAPAAMTGVTAVPQPVPSLAPPVTAPPPRLSSSATSSTNLSSTDGLAEEPLQPVYRNAMLFAAEADAAAQRRRTETGGGAHDGGQAIADVPTPPQTTPCRAEGGGTAGAPSPLRYTGFANYGSARPGPPLRQPGSAAPPPLSSNAEAAHRTQAPAPPPPATATYAPRVPMGTYAPQQPYRQITGVAPMHFSNFVSATAAIPPPASRAWPADTADAVDDDDEEEVEDLDAVHVDHGTSVEKVDGDTATTVGEAIRFARAGQLGECMHTNDGKPHVTQAVLQRLPSYAPVSMRLGAQGTLDAVGGASGFHGAPLAGPSTATANAPPYRMPNMPRPMFAPGTAAATSTGEAGPATTLANTSPPTASQPVVRASPPSAAATSVLKATATTTNTTSAVTAAGPRTAASLMGPSFSPSSPTSQFAPTHGTTSSRRTGHSERGRRAAAPPSPSLRPTPSSSLGSSVVNAASPATVAARHGGYLCLVMEYHPMGDLSRYVLRNQQVLEAEAQQHQRSLAANAHNVTASTTRSHSAGGTGSPSQGSLPRTPSPAASMTSAAQARPTPGLAPRAAMPIGGDGATSHTLAGGKPTSSLTAGNPPSAGLTATASGASATLHSSSHTLSSAASLSFNVMGGGGGGVSPPKVRPVSYSTLLDMTSADPTALNPLTESQLLSIAYQLASVLRHLHAQNPPIIHRNLKPENILIKGNPRDLLAEDVDVPTLQASVSGGLSGANHRDGVAGRRVAAGEPVRPDEPTEDEEEVINLDVGAPGHGEGRGYSPASVRSHSPHSPVSPSAPSSQGTSQRGHGTGAAASERRTLANTRTTLKIIPIVLTDFGLSMVQDAGALGKRAGRGGGTRPYIAPEAWKGLTSTASDMWGYGCVLYALATGRLTARTVRIMSDEARREGFASMVLNDLLSRRYSLAFASFVVSLLVVEPAKRPTAAMAERCFLVSADEVRFDATSPFFSNVLDL